MSWVMLGVLALLSRGSSTSALLLSYVVVRRPPLSGQLSICRLAVPKPATLAVGRADEMLDALTTLAVSISGRLG